MASRGAQFKQGKQVAELGKEEKNVVERQSTCDKTPKATSVFVHKDNVRRMGGEEGVKNELGWEWDKSE